MTHCFNRSDDRQPHSKHPLEEVLWRLPSLPVSPSGALQFERASPNLLSELAENAEAGAGALTLGLAAIGTLIAHSAVPMEDGAISSDSIEALGWLLGEIGVVASFCQTLAVDCRRAQKMVKKRGGDQSP